MLRFFVYRRLKKSMRIRKLSTYKIPFKKTKNES